MPRNMIQLENGSGFAIALLPYGASWASCRVPLSDGSVREVLLGCRNAFEYRRHPLVRTACLGATIGRFANRIRRARFDIAGETCMLDQNDGEHCLHGGHVGFGQRDWTIEELTANRVRFSIISAAGDGGFPGQMTAETCYSIDGNDSCVSIEFLAAVDRPCPTSLTNHAYFNLDGDGADSRQHQLRLASRHYLPIDADGIPVATVQDVSGTPFDFTTLSSLATSTLEHPQLNLNRGYNHAFLIDTVCHDLSQPVAELAASDGRLTMKMYSTLPALHLYGGNYLSGTPSRNGMSYENYAGVALEAGFLPDSPNHPEWPQASCILYPGSVYRHCIRYRFSEGNTPR